MSSDQVHSGLIELLKQYLITILATLGGFAALLLDKITFEQLTVLLVLTGVAEAKDHVKQLTQQRKEPTR